MTHGDEVGSLPGMLEVMTALSSGAMTFGGTVDFFIGNTAAGLANRRFVEADLNRVFLPEAPPSLERTRALQLESLLTDCDLFIDFHQTARPSQLAFYTLPWRPQEASWIRALQGGSAWITRPAGQSFSPGMKCADEFVRDQGRPGLTLELGEKGFSSDATVRTAAVIRRALSLLDAIATRGPNALQEAADAQPEIPLYQYSYAHPYERRTHQLREGLVNFQPVVAGEDLSAPSSPPIRVPHDGMLLFPKYPPADTPLPAAQFRLASPLTFRPEEQWL